MDRWWLIMLKIWMKTWHWFSLLTTSINPSVWFWRVHPQSSPQTQCFVQMGSAQKSPACHNRQKTQNILDNSSGYEHQSIVIFVLDLSFFRFCSLLKLSINMAHLIFKFTVLWILARVYLKKCGGLENPWSAAHLSNGVHGKLWSSDIQNCHS